MTTTEQAQPAYDLAHEPDGTAYTARDNLVDILERELVGPLKGEHEVLELAPDTSYLLGRIAPRRLKPKSDAPAGDEVATDVGDDLDADASTGVPLAAVDDSTAADSTEDDVDDQPQKRGIMIPASMGLRFQLPADVESFVVTASWGTYHTIDSGRVTRSGAKIRHFQRTPHALDKRIVVAGIPTDETLPVPLDGDVLLRIDRYDDGDRRLIEIALCNDAETPRKIPIDAWLFQTALSVEAGGEAVFLPVNDVVEDTRREPDAELRRLNLQYRNRLEYAIGRTCSVTWDAATDTRQAHRVCTAWLPVVETPATRAVEVDGAQLDMDFLASASAEEVQAALAPIVGAYESWLDGQARQAAELPEHLRADADELVIEARQVSAQLRDGLEFLVKDPEALRCFGFMNAVMRDQRVHGQVAELRAKEPELPLDDARQRVLDNGPGAHSWRAFQIAFVLMQLRALTNPDDRRRSSDRARVELLFFPTGGGKTEAYLGLAAYTFAIRRRQGVVESADGPLNGHDGVAVLMRYTLRLLTSQQFQRAAALVCAAELQRRADEATWGTEPFRIGLWVGTGATPKRYDEAEEQVVDANKRRGRLGVLQTERCPWCGNKLGAADVACSKPERRVRVYCSDEFGECPFSKGGGVDDGIPVLTVDEEIYRLAPAFVIATVDKFARLAREGHAATLFGYVHRRCDRHGYVHPDYSQCDILDGSMHYARDGLPAAAVRPATRLRPPDLIIQDELHLITGALGTAVGVFEIVIDTLCSWRALDSEEAPSYVRPLIVASTATVRNAAEQVRGLYGRGVTMFPPPVLDVANSFFAKELTPGRSDPENETAPGRRYIGLSTTGVRLTTAEIRVATVLLAAGQLMIDRDGDVADPYLTLVGYFNATRELAGMTRYVQDDIQTALAKPRPDSGLPRRLGAGYGSLKIGELTARVQGSDITRTLDDMAVEFDSDYDSSGAREQRIAAEKAGRDVERRATNPYDAVLATSMLQVGVDVGRLGLMMIVGQPKNTAEYIQASSRVGRLANRPGLVVTLGNWARPRDLAHYEQFRHYHETFYARVEALSVTPFSATALDRGLDAVLVSAARVMQAHRADGLSPDSHAGRIDVERDAVEVLIDRLVWRIRQAARDDGLTDRARDRLVNRLGQWTKRNDRARARRRTLVYDRVFDEGAQEQLMRSAETLKSRTDRSDAPPFVVANSMREVQPEINLLVTPDPDKQYAIASTGHPEWQFDVEEDEA